MKVFKRKIAYQRDGILLIMAGLMGMGALLALVSFILIKNDITKSLLVFFTYSITFHGVLYFTNSQLHKFGVKQVQLFNAFIYSIFTIIALYNPFGFPYLWAYLLFFPIMIGLIENETIYKIWSGFYIILYATFLINNHYKTGESHLFIIIFILFATLSILLGFLMVKYLSFVREVYAQNSEQQMKKHIFEVLSSLIPIVEAKSHTTKNEITEMNMLMKKMMQKLPNLDVKDWEIELLSLLHFVSRIEWPDYIFEKHDSLTEFERKIVQNHCVIGCKLLGDFHSLAHVKEAFFKHHQRKDGSGYPNNHPGDPIPKLAQILGLVEIYLAMIHPRAYHDPKTREEALAEIRELERKRVDPEILLVFEDAIYHLDMMDVS
jgi:ABC-type multidrug transport system fused ATPase/permease subunit